MKSCHGSLYKETPLLLCQNKIVLHEHPQSPKLGHTVISQWLPISKYGTKMLVRVWLCQQGHTEAAKVSPHQKVKRLESEGALINTVHILWAPI